MARERGDAGDCEKSRASCAERVERTARAHTAARLDWHGTAAHLRRGTVDARDDEEVGKRANAEVQQATTGTGSAPAGCQAFEIEHGVRLACEDATALVAGRAVAYRQPLRYERGHRFEHHRATVGTRAWKVCRAQGRVRVRQTPPAVRALTVNGMAADELCVAHGKRRTLCPEGATAMSSAARDEAGVEVQMTEREAAQSEGGATVSIRGTVDNLAAYHVEGVHGGAGERFRRTLL